MRAHLRRLLVTLCICTGALTAAAPLALAAGGPSAWSADAQRGIQELMGTGDGSPVGWDGATGLWGGQTGPRWWQSALAMWTLVRYAQRTHDLSPAIQYILRRTYYLNDYRPQTTEPHNFTNQFMDDTAWWGQAWLAASQYERYDLHDRRDAAAFLAVSEWDASYIAGQPRPCGGVEWDFKSAPDTITNAEFAALTAGLFRYREAPGVFHDPARARRWLADAQGALAWLQHSGLIDVAGGKVRDHLSSTACQNRIGDPITYTEGEVADALVQIGEALHDPSYYAQAANFLRYTVSSASGFITGGVLEDHCQAKTPNCAGSPNQLTVTPFKGIFMQAVADWSAATKSSEFSSFVDDQANAITSDDIWGASPSSPGCGTPHGCQFGFDWTGQVPTMLVTVGTQVSALDALTAALP